MKLKEIIKFVETKHQGQVDKAGEPYFLHPKRVADSIWNYFNDIYEATGYLVPNGWDYMIVAFFHDIIEDTDTTVEELEQIGLFPDVIEGILSVTRKDGESYGDFIKRASENKYGLIVKYFDLIDNLDVKRLKKISEEDITRINKYLKWYHYLDKKIEEIAKTYEA